MAAPVRLLLLEFLCHRDARCETSMFFPYLQGAARECGAETRWLYFVGAPRFRWDRPRGRALRASVPEVDFAVLRAELERFRPTHVLCNELVVPELGAVIGAAGAEVLALPSEFDLEGVQWGERGTEMDAPLARVSGRREDRNCLHKPAWFADWLGARPHPREGEHLLDAATPVYEAARGNDDCVGFEPSFPLLLLGGQSCRGRPTVAGNPRFEPLDDLGRFNAGCSFCGGSDERGMLAAHRRGSLALAEEQLRLIQATDPAVGRGRGVYIVHDLALFLRIDSFFKMLARGNFRPSRFVFCPRIDDALKTRERIESVLPLAAATGHQIGFDVMGIENFSPETMALYNKDISAAQADALVALMAGWRERWPQVFPPFGGAKEWLMLLFTPWTTLADLRLNYAEASRRGFDGDGLWTCTSLLLRKGSALAALAEKEGGILAPEFEDRGLLFFPVCGMQALWGALPWRFKDPRVADVFRVLIRVHAALERPESRPLFGADPEFDLFARIHCDQEAAPGAPLRRPPWTLLEVALPLLDLVEKAPAPRSRAALLREAVAAARRTARASRPEPADPSAPPPLPPLVEEVLGEVARLLRSRKSPALAGLTLESAQAHPRMKGCLRLDLRLDGRELAIALLDRGHPAPAFLETAARKVIYLKEDAEWSGPELAAASGRLTLLVSLIERRLAAPRAVR